MSTVTEPGRIGGDEVLADDHKCTSTGLHDRSDDEIRVDDGALDGCRHAGEGHDPPQ
jgi:hypothetical protein